MREMRGIEEERKKRGDDKGKLRKDEEHIRTTESEAWKETRLPY
jgi:hypothetical protein